MCESGFCFGGEIGFSAPKLAARLKLYMRKWKVGPEESLDPGTEVKRKKVRVGVVRRREVREAPPWQPRNISARKRCLAIKDGGVLVFAHCHVCLPFSSPKTLPPPHKLAHKIQMFFLPPLTPQPPLSLPTSAGGWSSSLPCPRLLIHFSLVWSANVCLTRKKWTSRAAFGAY